LGVTVHVELVAPPAVGVEAGVVEADGPVGVAGSPPQPKASAAPAAPITASASRRRIFCVMFSLCS
jgi:hypothetical protein